VQLPPPPPKTHKEINTDNPCVFLGGVVGSTGAERLIRE